MVKDVVLVGMEILEKNFSVARSGSDLEVAYVMVVELLSCLQLTMLIDFSQDSDVVAKCGSTAPATLIKIAAWMVPRGPARSSCLKFQQEAMTAFHQNQTSPMGSTGQTLRLMEVLLQKKQMLEQPLVETIGSLLKVAQEPNSQINIPLTFDDIAKLELDENSNIRLRHKLSSVRLSKLKKAPPLEGKAEELAPKVPLITVTVADPSGKSADVVD